MLRILIFSPIEKQEVVLYTAFPWYYTCNATTILVQIIKVASQRTPTVLKWWNFWVRLCILQALLQSILFTNVDSKIPKLLINLLNFFIYWILLQSEFLLLQGCWEFSWGYAAQVKRKNRWQFISCKILCILFSNNYWRQCNKFQQKFCNG